jgi:hypothetical protein
MGCVMAQRLARRNPEPLLERQRGGGARTLAPLIMKM